MFIFYIMLPVEQSFAAIRGPVIHSANLDGFLIYSVAIDSLHLVGEFKLLQLQTSGSKGFIAEHDLLLCKVKKSCVP